MDSSFRGCVSFRLAGVLNSQSWRYLMVGGICSALLVIFQLPVAAGAQIPAVSAPGNTSFSNLSTQAAAARDANRLDDALSLYKKALALKPRWAEGWWSLGTIAYDRNSYPDAAHAFRKVIELAPANGNAYVMLGLTEFELGDDDWALKHIDKGERLGLDPDDELRRVALYDQGVLLQRKEKFHAAREILEQLCLQGVHGKNISNALGLTLLRQASKADPEAGSTDADVVERIGDAECLAGEKKFDEARKEFGAAVAQYPKYPKIHYAYGLFLVEASDLPAGIEQFKAEIVNNPADVISRLQIAAAMFKTDSAAGVAYAQQAVKLEPQQPFAHFLLGLLLLDTDNFQQAIPELENARTAFPREARIYLALGTAYSRAGRISDAERARATAKKIMDTPGSHEADQSTFPEGELLSGPKQ